MEILSSTCPMEADLSGFDSHNHDQLMKEFHEQLQNHEDQGSIQLSEINDWMDSNHVLRIDECLDDQEIVQIVNEENAGRPEEQNEDEKENDTSDAVDSSETVKALSRAQDNLNNVIEFREKHPHYSNEDLLGLYRVRDAMKSQIFMPNPCCSS